MSSWLDGLDRFFLRVQANLTWAWQDLVTAEREHPIILAIAVFIVISCILSLCCSCCTYCCPDRRKGYILVKELPPPNKSYGAVQKRNSM